VTIVPRGNGALGFAQYLPKEIFLRTREQLLDMVCMALAGRASEQINFGKVTTGAADDLRRVTQIVYQMVQVYGMNDKVGQVAFPKEEGQWPQDRLYSNATAEVMDEEVRLIVDEAYKRTLRLMEDCKEQVRMVAELLIEKETITNMDVTKLIGARKYSAGKDYDAYVNSAWTSAEEQAAKAEAEAAQKSENEEGNTGAPIAASVAL
jgi:AFG3 family protein